MDTTGFFLENEENCLKDVVPLIAKLEFQGDGG